MYSCDDEQQQLSCISFPAAFSKRAEVIQKSDAMTMSYTEAVEVVCRVKPSSSGTMRWKNLFKSPPRKNENTVPSKCITEGTHFDH